MSLDAFLQSRGVTVAPASLQPVIQPSLSRIFGNGPTEAERSWSNFDYDPERKPWTFGTTLELTRGQRARERAAMTTVRSGMRDVRRYGLQDEYEEFREEQQPGVFSHLTGSIFDLLNGTIYSSAGFFRELVRSGDATTAFRRAVSELANAAPGIDEKLVQEWGLPKPERTTWSDSLKDAGMGTMGAATAGFMLDILLDPSTWIPGVNLMKPFAMATKAGFRGGKALALKTQAGQRMADVLGDKFIYGHRLKQSDVGQRALEIMEKERHVAEAQAEDFYTDLAESVMSQSDHAERVMAGFYLDNPRDLIRRVDELEQAGLFSADQGAKVKDDWRYLHGKMKGIWDAESKDTPHGVPALFDWGPGRRFYAFGTTSGTARTRAANATLQEELVDRGVISPGTYHATPERSVFAKPSTTPTQTYAKKYESTQERILAGLDTEFDGGVMLTKRGLAHLSEESARRLIDSTISDPLIAARVVADVPQGIRQDLSQAMTTRGLTGNLLDEMDEKLASYGYKVLRWKRGKHDIVGAWALPTDIVDTYTRVTKSLEDPDEIQKVLNLFDRMQNLWKGWALFSTGYHSRNLQGGGFNNWVMGVGKDWGKWLAGQQDAGENFLLLHAKAMMIAGRFERREELPKWMQWGLQKTFGDPGQVKQINVPKPGGGIYTNAELWQLAREEGVTGRGMFAKDMPNDYDRFLLRQMDYVRPPKLDLAKLNAAQVDETTKALLVAAQEQAPMWGRVEGFFGTSGAAMRLSRGVGTLAEDTLRLAHFMDRLIKRMTPTQAAMSTKKTHFDYTELTPFEKDVMKRLVPFYSWLRFNLPLQIQAIMENPSRYSRFPKLVEEIQNMTSDWDDVPTPDYFQELHAVRLPILRNDKPLYLNPNLPFQNLNVFDDKAKIASVMQNMTPFIKVAFEQMPDRGYSIFMDREIEDYPGQAARVIPGVGRKTEQAIETLVPPLSKYVVRPIRAAERGELLEQGLTELAGVKVIANDVRRTVRGQRLFEDNIMRMFRRKAREENRLPQ